MPKTAIFPEAEFSKRCTRAQTLMAAQGIDALLLTSEPDVRYFTGFLTRFWESPTRPWFVILPAQGTPIAVIPAIGAHLMYATWITDIRTWDAPDYTDDGVTLLAETLRDVTPANARIATPMGRETTLRMPLADWDHLNTLLSTHKFRDATPLLRALQSVKSDAEIALIRAACDTTGRAFARVPEIARPGATLAQIFRHFQMLLLDEGADYVPYLAGASDYAGYSDVISPAHNTPLSIGDILMLDTGAVVQGYFCDFNRNWSVGPARADIKDAHRILFDVTEAAFATARPGATAQDLHAVMLPMLNAHSHFKVGGRLGHGLGMRLTEAPSLIAADDTELVPGMVLTLEPALHLGPDRMMVHEENIVIRDSGAEWLSPRGPRDLPELAWPT